MGRHYKGRSIIQDEIRMELCVKGVRQMQANSASDWVSETKPQQNTFIRQINNFPYPKFVRILSEGIVAFESANTALPVLWVEAALCLQTSSYFRILYNTQTASAAGNSIKVFGETNVSYCKKHTGSD